MKQDRDGWENTITKMQGFGMQADEAQVHRILEYLAKNFHPDTAQKLNINLASSIELQAALSLRRSVAAEVIRYRARNGGFRSVDDLKKIPGVDPEKVDLHREGLTV